MLLISAVRVAAAAEREVRIECDWGAIYATLATPDDGVQPQTAIVIVAGSGPTDRNGNSAAGMRPASYKMLSDELCRAGYAVLRYDKRAIGRSVYPAEKIADLTFDDYVDDAAACVDFLRGEGYAKVAAAGHSEGSLIVLCLAGLRPLDGAVLLSGAGYGIDIILGRQIAAQLISVDIGLMAQATIILGKLAAGKYVDDVPQALQPLMGRHVQPFIISQIRHDPVEEIRRLDLPILLVAGGRDIQITVDNAERLHAAAPASQLVVLPDMTHVLKDCDSTDMIAQLSGVYTDSTLPLSVGLSQAIADFLETI